MNSITEILRNVKLLAGVITVNIIAYFAAVILAYNLGITPPWDAIGGIATMLCVTGAWVWEMWARQGEGE